VGPGARQRCTSTSSLVGGALRQGAVGGCWGLRDSVGTCARRRATRSRWMGRHTGYVGLGWEHLSGGKF
jgi:hypothetical protein